MQDRSMIFRVLLLLTCAVNLGCSVRIELYSKQNYSGLLKKINMTPKLEEYCIQFDQTYEVRSLKTERCVMVYETEDCNRIEAPAEGSKMYSVRVERDTALFDIDGAYSNRKEERGIKSFHLCGTGVGEGLLNVDIYSGPSYTGDLVASYEGVCECKNIPSYMSNGLKGKPFSIDNNGKNMYFYDGENCTGQQRLISAGDNERSRSVFRLDDARAVVIRSFRLADALSCPKLYASVHNFTFPDWEEPVGKYAQQNTTYTLTNKEHTTAREYITINDLFAAEYTVARAFTYIHSTHVKAGVLITSNNSIITVLGSTLQSSLEAHYLYPDTNQNIPTIVTWPYGSQRVPFVKPACTTCTAIVSVNKFQAIPISYTAEAIVTGVTGEDKLSAEQIRYFLPPGMKYVKDYDDNSVVVTVEGKMKGSLGGVDKEISCLPLPVC